MHSWDWELFWDQGIFLRKCKESWFLGAGRKSIKPNSTSTPFFYLPDFFLSSQDAIWEPIHLQEFTTEELEFSLEKIKNGFKKEPRKQMDPNWSWELPEYCVFEKYWQNLRMLFKNRQLQKIVPVLFETTKVTPNFTSKVDMLLSCLQRDAKYYPYGFWDKKEGLFGLSSEVLFEQSEGLIKTMALASTRSRQEHGNLLQIPKEVKEHQYVIDALEENLAYWGKVQQEKTKEWNVGNLVHLKTDLSVKTSQSIPFFELVERLHPTPALGGTPRQLAWDWLKQRSENRGRYGAPFGICQGEGLGFVLVAIRNIQWQKGRTLLGSGCGIVEESQIEKEWHELMLKRKAVKELLHLSNALSK